MWTTRTRALSPSIVGVSVTWDGKPVTFANVFREWTVSDSFRTHWTLSLRDISFEAYCWEMPPLTPTSLSEAFECVFVESPLLANETADPAPFAEHFRSGEDAVIFESLGRDAALVAPCPEHPNTAYGHLAAFLRTAPGRQSGALWKLVAQAFEQRVGGSPVWLSTAGLGVSWLHVRLDSRPKYYRYRPYTLIDYWRQHTRAPSP